MAVSIIGTPLAINDGTSYTAEAGSDRVVAVVVGVTEFNSVTFAPTFGGQAFTQGTFIEGTDRSYAYIGYIKEANIPAGSNAFALNPSGAVDATDGTIYTLSGVDQTTVGSGFTLDDSPGSATPVLNITGVADGVAVAVHTKENSGIQSADPSWTARSLNAGTATQRVHTADKTTTAGADTFEPGNTIAGEGVLASFVFNAASDPTNTITVDVPTHIDLEWGTTHELAVTDDTGTVTLAGVTLSAPTGWETVAFTTAPNPATTESFYEYAQTDTGLGGAGYTMLAGDILAWETQTGLTIDGQTIPQVDPPATVSGSYKIFKDATKTWTSVSTFTITDLGFPDAIAPILSSPTGTETGDTTATGTVSTDDGTGTLYYYASTNSSETAATIKASGSSQAVSLTGVQNVSFTGLTSSTVYYAHYVQDDSSANESNVVSSASFTTQETPDTTAPVLSSPTGTAVGPTAGAGTVTTDEGNGTLYYLISTNITETAATIKASGNTKAVSSAGIVAVAKGGLVPETTYYIHYVQDDTSANESNVVSSASFITPAAGALIPQASNEQLITFFRNETSVDSYNLNELAIAYYKQAGATAAAQFNDALKAAQDAVPFTGLAPVDWRNYV